MSENDIVDYPDVRLHQLEGFYYVALHQGFTRASERMPFSISQPALHQQVRKLEDRLGRSLIVKGPERRMVMTPEGRALFEFIAPFYEQLPGVLRSVAHGSAGSLVVATDPFFVADFCAPVLASLYEQLPDAQLQLLEKMLPEMEDGLHRGEIDLAICTVVDVQDGLVFESFGRLGLQLQVPARHPLARRKGPLQVGDLLEHSFVLYERGSEGRKFTDLLLQSAELEVQTAAETSSAAAMASLVGSGLAPAFLPALQPLARKRVERDDGIVAYDLSELVEEVAELPRFGMLRRRGVLPAGLVRAFQETARQLVESWQDG